MKTIKTILSIAIIACFFASPNSLAMKRTHSDDEEASSLKTSRIEIVGNELNWFAYVEMLSIFYDINKLSFPKKFQALCKSAFKPAKTLHGQQIWQAWVTLPNAKDILCSLYEEDDFYKLLLSFGAENADGLSKEGAFVAKAYIGKASTQVIVDYANSIPDTDLFPLKFFIGELLSIQPGFEPRKDKNLSRELFSQFLEERKDLSFGEKIRCLHNGPLNVKTKQPLRIKLKDDACLTIRITAAKYDSNVLAESNFLPEEYGIKPGTLRYYRIALHLWDLKNETESETESVVVTMPLDAGYGKPALPSEIFWFQREEHISGKEMLDFLKQLFTSLRPKIIYLNDASMKKIDDIEIKLRILCPLISGKSFYAAHGQFEVVDCEKLECHQGTIIKQSKENYEKCVAILHKYPLCNLSYYLNKNEALIFKAILDKFDICSLGALFKALLDPAMQDDLHYLYNLLTDTGGSIQKSDQTIEMGISILNRTTLWKCEAYAKQ